MWAWLQLGDWHSTLQLLVDGLLLVLVLVLLWDRRRNVSSASSQHVVESFQRILAETQTLSDAFDRNLKERGRLIEKLLESLDAKLEEARTILKRLEQHRAVASDSLHAPPRDSSLKTPAERILQLADAGHSPQDIASRVRRPVGEVELVLNLHKLQHKKSE